MKYRFTIYAVLLALLVSFNWGCASKSNIKLSEEKPTFNILFENDTNMLSCYILYWYDHGLDSNVPAPMCGGELKPGDSNLVEQNYPVGLWSIYWSGCANSEWSNHRELVMDYVTDDFFITTTPLMDKIE